MPRLSLYIALLLLVAAILAGCATDTLRPRRPDALPEVTDTVAAPTAIATVPPGAAATDKTPGTDPQGIVTGTITIAPPPATGAYPPPAAGDVYPAPTGPVSDVALLPMVARPPTDSDPASPHIPSIAATVPAGFVQARGPSLVLDGEPYYFLGVNAHYLLYDYFPEREVEPIIRYLAETGGVNVIRIFFLPGNDPERFERILDLGHQYGIRFIVTLQNFHFHKTQTWFDVHYKEEDLPHIRAVVPRFRDRPEILMWELMNEPGCAEGDDPERCQQHIYNWAAAVSAEIKALAPHHLISIGTLSAEGTRYHKSNYEKMHELPTVDVISLHRFVGKRSRTEMRLAAELNKPIFVGEAWHASYRRDRCEPVSGSALAERADKIVEDLEWSFEHGLDGYLLWQYNPEYVITDDGNRQWYCCEFSYLEGDPSYTVLREHLARLRAGEGVDSRVVD